MKDKNTNIALLILCNQIYTFNITTGLQGSIKINDLHTESY